MDIKPQPVYTLIFCADVFDGTEYMHEHTDEIIGSPLFMYNVMDMQGIDITDSKYQIIKTQGFVNRPDYERCEAIMLGLKRASYARPITFITVLDVLIPCMDYELYALSIPLEWPEEVEDAARVIRGSITTMHGRKYEVYCGSFTIKKFCGNNVALALGGPVVFTGGLS